MSKYCISRQLVVAHFARRLSSSVFQIASKTGSGLMLLIAAALGPNTVIGNVALAACAPNGTGSINCDPGTVETVVGVRVAGGTSTSIIGTDLKMTGYVGFGTGTGGAWRGSNYDILIDQSTVSSDALFLNMGWANNIDFTVSNSTLNFKLLDPRGGTSLNFWRAGSNNTFRFDNVVMNNNFGATIFESGPEGPVVNNNYYVNDVVINGQTDIGWLISGAGGEAVFDGLVQPDSVRAGVVAYSSGIRRLVVRNSVLGGENNLGAIRWFVDDNATDPISTVQIENTTIDTSAHSAGLGLYLPVPDTLAGHAFDIDVSRSTIKTDPSREALFTNSIADVRVRESNIAGIQSFERNFSYIVEDSVIEGLFRANDSHGDFASRTRFVNTTFVGEYQGGVGSDELHIVGRSDIQNAVLDGGKDISATESFTDTLVFKDMQADLDTANVRNWESVIVDNSLISLTGDRLGVGGLTADGLSVINGSVIDAPKLFELDGNMTVGPTGTFRGTGTGTGLYSILGNVSNLGVLDLQDGIAGDVVLVTGDLMLGDDGTLAVDFEAPNLSDGISVSGATTLGGTLAVTGVGTMDAFADGQVFTLIDSAGAVSGTFSNVTDTLPDFDVIPETVDGGDGGHEVVLGLRGTSMPDPATPPKLLPLISDKSIVPNSQQAQLRTLRVFDGALKDRMAGRASQEASLRDGSVVNAYADDRGQDTADRWFNDPPSTTPAPAAYSKLLPIRSAWMSGLGGLAKADISSFAPAYETDVFGIAAGIDIEARSSDLDWLLGAAVGYTVSDVTSGAGSSDVEVLHLGGYGRVETDGARASAQLSYGIQSYDFLRLIPVGGTVLNAAGSTDGHLLSTSVGGAFDIAKEFDWAQSYLLQIAPAATFGYVYSRRNSYTETGAGLFNQAYDPSDFERSYLRAGIEFGAAIDLGNTATFHPRAGLHWEWGFGEDSLTVTSTAPAVPGSAFVSSGTAESDSGLVFEAGFDLNVNKTLVRADYEGHYSDTAKSHRLTGTLTFSF